MIKLIMVLLVLGAVSLILGMPWAKAMKVRYQAAFAYGTGYFLELALFHIAAFPIAVLHIRFHVLTIVYSILLIVSCLASLVWLYRTGSLKLREPGVSRESLRWHEWILLAVFVVSVVFQVYRGIVSDLTYMAADDSAYVAMANDALITDYIGTTDPYTGVAAVLNIQRVIQTSLYFPAYLTAITGISVAAMEHTVQYIQFVVLAYAVYIWFSAELFERRENRLVFLAFVSVFFIFGHHSVYSLTFRLLGPNYQGKAVLAASLTPLILAFLIHVLKEPYRSRNGVLMFFLSTAAVSLTLWGTGTVFVIVTIPIILSQIRKQRDWKHLWYIPWSITVPFAFIVFYSMYAL